MRIRNFSIIAHIDHGKSTLADRLLEATGTISPRDMREQVLDTMDLERERGITIKAQAVRIRYPARDGKEYIFNLIDTPGHVDFSYEVSRSLAACEGAILVVDASQGIEAQTLANYQLAKKNNLTIIPVINKIDLPNAEPEKVKKELEEVFGIDPARVIFASAKEGIGTEQILEAIIKDIPPPQGDPESPLQALIFDSQFDPFRGVITYVRLLNGTLRPGMTGLMMGTHNKFEVQEVGIFKPSREATEELRAGEVGYVIGGIKNVAQARVGDTITDAARPAREPLPGYQKAKPMVFCGLYPIHGEDFGNLKVALEKLELNDAALSFEPETSAALGFGFRIGFLGLLHLEIVKERLTREYQLELLATAPNVIYKVISRNQKEEFIDNPAKLPDAAHIERIEEPYFRVTLFTPANYLGTVMELANDKRGNFINLEYFEKDRAMLTYELPLAEVITDFHDRLKSATAGYASLDYELIGYKPSDLVKLNILLNQEPVDALSFIVHRDKAYHYGKQLVERLRDVIPRQQFEVPIQAAIGGRIISRETVKAIRKNVLQKCYGGDVTRKRKLLEKQKAGKKKMKRIGKVDVPPEAFMAVLKMGS